MRHADIGCEVSKIEFDYDTFTGLLRVPKGNCPDMAGTVAAFLYLFPLVNFIGVVEGDLPSLAYVRDEGGIWRTHLMPRPGVGFKHGFLVYSR